MIHNFREEIIRPTLKLINKWSLAAENLLYLTFLCESNGGEFLRQIGGGPALGVFQIEPKTYYSVIKWLNRYENRVIKETCLSACYYVTFPSEESLIYNLRWSTIIARILYFSITKPLPLDNDILGLATYYKDYYNRQGGATIERAMEIYQRCL